MELRRTSSTILFGLPLYDIRVGNRWSDPARGIVAIGIYARGVFACGVQACGIVSFGVLSVGVVSLGTIALGLLSGGVLAAGLFGAGGVVAVAPYAAGVVAIGYYACGVTALGAHVSSASQNIPHGRTPPAIFWILNAAAVSVPIIGHFISRRGLRETECEKWRGRQDTPLSPDELSKLKSFLHFEAALAVVVGLVTIVSFVSAAQEKIDFTFAFKVLYWSLLLLLISLLAGRCPRCGLSFLAFGGVIPPPSICLRCKAKLRRHPGINRPRY